MVAKTRRKRSAAKRVKTAKRRKNNTRSKRGRGRAHGRSAKRGGMTPAAAAARIAARSAAAAAKHTQRILPQDGPLYGVKPKTFSEQFIDKEKETTGNPVEMAITGKGVGDNMEKSEYNDQRHKLFANQTPDRPYNPVYFSTPKPDSTLDDIHRRPIIDSTPAGPSSDLSSPPPPRDDLSIRGNRLPYNPMDFADMAARNPIQKLDFGDEFEAPESSPYRNSASSLRKTFKTKPGEHRSDTASSPSPTPPRFRI
jgi:hypothetical protein